MMKEKKSECFHYGGRKKNTRWKKDETGGIIIKLYTEFVTRICECIFRTFDQRKSALEVFAEGYDCNQSSCQEYSVLRNDKAKLFLSVIQENVNLFGILEKEYNVSHSRLYSNEVKISHSCYPKNLRRWLNGTISRKKKCRIDFCVLVYCHAIGWNFGAIEVNKIKYLKCQEQLVAICNSILGKINIVSFRLINFGNLVQQHINFRQQKRFVLEFTGIIKENRKGRWVMRNEKNVKELDQLNEDLSIVKLFVNRKIFKKLCFLCSGKGSANCKKQSWGKRRLGFNPDISDFFRAIGNLSTSLFPTDVESSHKRETCDPATVLVCLEILFRNQDYKCIEKICQLIDEKDCDEEAVRIRKILLTTRNNLTTAKVNRG